MFSSTPDGRPQDTGTGVRVPSRLASVDRTGNREGVPSVVFVSGGLPLKTLRGVDPPESIEDWQAEMTGAVLFFSPMLPRAHALRSPANGASNCASPPARATPNECCPQLW